MGVINKKGQIAIFIIIALVVVVGIILAAVLIPKFKPSATNVNSDNPKAFIESCLKEDIRSNLERIGLGGGFSTPEGNIMYKGQDYKYLCYTNQNYIPCVVQEPLIKDRIESEMTIALKERVQDCVKQFADESERRGNKISVGKISGNVELNTGNVIVNVIAPMTITSEVSRNFNNFKIEYPSNMYDLSFVATSIVSFEATYGNSEITTYLQYYPNLIIEKTKLSDGSTIYIVSDVTTNEKFAFASRSLAWPPGS
ncbi:MAG: hypothetical protein Q7R87_00740 [Nanoarchaeota archaeon]|nr:hypothetical protein [Nanoarchaeota archaeon]